MADETSFQHQGPNGERVEVRLGDKAFGLSAKDLIPVLLLILLGIGGYLLYTAMDRRIADMQAHQIILLQAVSENRLSLAHDLESYRAFLVEKVQESDRSRQAQTDVLRRLLLRHDYNQDKLPAERLPLEIEVQPPK